MAKDKVRWFKPGKPSGWKTNMPKKLRRGLVLKAHGNDYLSAARAKTSTC